jgi:hypothetical protein
MRSGGDLVRRPVEFIHRRVVGWEGADLGVVGGDVFAGLGFEVQGMLARYDVADDGEATMADGIELGS